MHQPTTLEAALARIAELEAKKNGPGLSLKVSTKGAVSLYGLGRWPVTLYASQWESLLAHQGALSAFLSANKDKLAVKEA